MALRGINLFLALTGQEEVQYRTFKRLGLSDTDVRGWFNGPAFLTWSRGQNEYGAGIAGPLPRSFMRAQYALQKLILARSRSLGMVGMLPGFQGNVPAPLKAVLADDNITVRGATGWMDSLDPNFGKIADMYMGELLASFGSEARPADHWYQLDGYFNGGTAPWLNRLPLPSSADAPPPADPLWRRRTAAAYAGLARADPLAVWSYQGFAFEHWSGKAKAAALRGVLEGVPKGKLVLVDMDYGDGEWRRYDGFWGVPFIWSKLHNFGGTDGLRGNLTRAVEVPADAMRSGSVVGSGFTDEGIDQNPAYHDLLLDRHFDETAAGEGAPKAAQRGGAEGVAESYLVRRALKRYGLSRLPHSSAVAMAASTAWTQLARSVYSQDVDTQDNTGVPHLPPRTKPCQQGSRCMWSFQDDRATPTPKMCAAVDAWDLLLTVARHASSGAGEGHGLAAPLSEPLRYDLVNVGREILAQIASPLALNLSDALHASPPVATDIEHAGQAYVSLLTDLDTLVATDPAFSLGAWLEMARALAGGTLAGGTLAGGTQAPPTAVGRGPEPALEEPSLHRESARESAWESARDEGAVSAPGKRSAVKASAAEEPAVVEVSQDDEHPPWGPEQVEDCTGMPGVPPSLVSCADFYDWNARVQLTTWNPVVANATELPDGPVDYASKHWSGLLRDYYAERARRLVAAAKANAARGLPFTSTEEAAIRAAHAFEFQTAVGTRYPSSAVGDALEVSTAMRAKWAKVVAPCR